ncbi:MAG TPA: ribosome small subunit-dependent GTPase A, partial [Bacillota bacterium]|nr:ribosome small subunit-dependent GTPase A [Bacillota bacterium]
MKEGRIVKALSGFYYVKSGQETYRCRGRGLFRKRKITPLVGDFVSFMSDHPDEGYITEIKQRTNELIRPPIANINQAIIVCSISKPAFSSLLLDQFLVLFESKKIQPVIFISKADKITDTDGVKSYMDAYENIGYDVELFSVKGDGDLAHLTHYFTDKVSVIAGQSGVGKSSMLNELDNTLFLKTDEVSERLGRGKHTTRHVELLD